MWSDCLVGYALGFALLAAACCSVFQQLVWEGGMCSPYFMCTCMRVCVCVCVCTFMSLTVVNDFLGTVPGRKAAVFIACHLCECNVSVCTLECYCLL